MIRSQAADFGYELNEFDPFFNYRATEFIIDNGISEYLEWHDYKSWHPNGRDISATSQVMLHLTAATTYQIFGGDSSLYDFTILFPVIFGSLTTIVIFALVRVLGGTTAGLLAAMLFSISVPIVIRGTLGWFKSEPLGLFYGLLGLYLFVSGIKSKNPEFAILKVLAAGMFLAFGLASWGGNQFFIIPLGIFFLALPFLQKDNKFQIWLVPLFTASLLGITAIFERPGINFVTGIGGLVLIGPTIFLVICNFVQKISHPEKAIRNGLLLLVGTLISGATIITAIFSFDVGNLPTHRYLNVINPFLTTTNPLVDSVSEHATTTLSQSFFFHSVLMIFAGIGIWLLLTKKDSSSHKNNDMIGFSLILGIIGVYVSSAFVRLEVFASISVIILASIGTSIILTQLFATSSTTKFFKQPSGAIKIAASSTIIFLLMTPIIIPAQGNWIDSVKVPPTILNGGTPFPIVSPDWPGALVWLASNTPEDSVVAAWWDYGYWITTIAERTTLADNATLDSQQIKNIATMFLSTPDDAWNMLQSMDADYVVVFVAAQKIQSDNSVPLYQLGGGGDESKKQWFMRIAEEPINKYLHSDGSSGTDYFWDNTLLGKMFPYSVALYYDDTTNQESSSYQPGSVPLYVKHIKYPIDGDGPLKLAYASPTYTNDSELSLGVFVYEVNKNYVPSNNISSVSNQEYSVISTNFGDIEIEFRDDVAPNHVENFKQLANSGFYDGTLFHRIVPGFVIQGGDPNTKSTDRSLWGQGNPGYTIEPEFNELSHKKYVVSMARAQEIDSAGSQFFIMLDDVTYLDGQYTVFGKVTFGFEVVDKIGSLSTNSVDQPLSLDDARINNIQIFTP